jgi:hypothetical protein
MLPTASCAMSPARSSNSSSRSSPSSWPRCLRRTSTPALPRPPPAVVARRWLRPARSLDVRLACQPPSAQYRWGPPTPPLTVRHRPRHILMFILRPMCLSTPSPTVPRSTSTSSVTCRAAAARLHAADAACSRSPGGPRPPPSDVVRRGLRPARTLGVCLACLFPSAQHRRTSTPPPHLLRCRVRLLHRC